MRRLAGFAMAVAVLALALGCGKKDSTESGGGGGGGGGGSSSSGIEGTYTITAMEVGGQDFSDFITKGKEEEKTIKITGDKLIATKDGKEDPATYKVDSSKNPKEIDITSQKTVTGPKNPKAKGGDKTKEKTVEEKMYGIYKVDGDKLTLCMVEGKAEERPKDFKTAGTKAVMMTLQKKK